MKIEKEFDAARNAWIFRPFGYIDLYNVPGLKNAMEEAEGYNVILSCEELTYIDSAGLSVLVDSLKARQEEGCFVKICRLKSYLYRIFCLANLQDSFDIREIEEAEQ